MTDYCSEAGEEGQREGEGPGTGEKLGREDLEI